MSFTLVSVVVVVVVVVATTDVVVIIVDDVVSLVWHFLGRSVTVHKHICITVKLHSYLGMLKQIRIQRKLMLCEIATKLCMKKAIYILLCK